METGKWLTCGMSWKLYGISLLCSLLTFSTGFAQQDESTSLEKCRSVLAADLTDAKAPAFGAYSATTPEAFQTAALDLKSNPIARAYRTILREQMSEKPNFAGHYRLAYWGCGASCAMFAVVNLKTGKVITAKEFATVAGTHLDADDFLPGTLSDSWGFRYKIDSSLLVVLGAPDEDEARVGAYYFALHGNELHLVHTTYAIRRHCDPRLIKRP
jgi:hypothetical protein